MKALNGNAAKGKRAGAIFRAAWWEILCAVMEIRAWWEECGEVCNG